MSGEGAWIRAGGPWDEARIITALSLEAAWTEAAELRAERDEAQRQLQDANKQWRAMASRLARFDSAAWALVEKYADQIPVEACRDLVTLAASCGAT